MTYFTADINYHVYKNTCAVSPPQGYYLALSKAQVSLRFGILSQAVTSVWVRLLQVALLRNWNEIYCETLAVGWDVNPKILTFVKCLCH